MDNKLINIDFTQDKIDLIKRTIAKDATDDELNMFISVAKRTGLDPFARQIYAVKRNDSSENRKIMTIQVSIDGFRLIAQRSGEYQGQTAPQWCGQDGIWKDLWTSDKPPYASRVGVWRKNFREPCYGVAKWDSYKVEYKNYQNGTFYLAPMWRKMGEVMLAKCAESLALRKAFPQELSDLYTREETQHMENEKTADFDNVIDKTAQMINGNENMSQDANGKAYEPIKSNNQTNVALVKLNIAGQWASQIVRLKMTEQEIMFIIDKFSPGHTKFLEMTLEEQKNAIEFLKKENTRE